MCFLLINFDPGLVTHKVTMQHTVNKQLTDAQFLRHRATAGDEISASRWSSTSFHMSTGPGRHQCKQSLLIFLLVVVDLPPAGMPVRVAVGAHHHGLGHVHHPGEPPPPARLPRPPHLLPLDPPQLPPDPLQGDLSFLRRPRPVAVDAVEPRAVLEVARRVGPQQRDEAGLAVSALGDALERRPDDASDSVGDAEVREVGGGPAAAGAGDAAAAFQETVDAEEPAAAPPDGVEPVEVDVEGVGGLPSASMVGSASAKNRVVTREHHDP